MDVDTCSESVTVECSGIDSVDVGQCSVNQTLDDPSTCSLDKPNSTRHNMLSRVANTDAHFRHQQRGEPDLSFDEKKTIAGEILDVNPGTFLSRYGKYLAAEDLSYFEVMRQDYTVNFYLQEINKRFADSKNHVKVRNRRYEAMRRLIDGQEYFSDEEMKARDPLLYEQMIGQYLTEDEVMEQAQKNIELSSVLFSRIEAMHNNELYAKQVQQEESQLEEGDSDEESEEDMEEDNEDDGFPDRMKVPSIPDEERHLLRQEFMAIMQQRFIHGQDIDYNYREIDENVEYDSLDIRTQDEQEKYFDEEDAVSVQSQCSSIDGGMDDCSGFKHMQITDICGECIAETCEQLESSVTACCDKQTNETSQKVGESAKQTMQTVHESEQTIRTVHRSEEQTFATVFDSAEQTNQSDPSFEAT